MVSAGYLVWCDDIPEISSPYPSLELKLKSAPAFTSAFKNVIVNVQTIICLENYAFYVVCSFLSVWAPHYNNIPNNFDQLVCNLANISSIHQSHCLTVVLTKQ